MSVRSPIIVAEGMNSYWEGLRKKFLVRVDTRNMHIVGQTETDRDRRRFIRKSHDARFLVER